MNKFEILNNTSIISEKIVEIIRSSKEYCYIISPYFQRWSELDNELDLARRQNKNVIFLIQDNLDKPYKNKEAVNFFNKENNFELYLIKNLHAKIYLNESQALISSMNLYRHSKNHNFESGVVIYDKSEIRNIKEHTIEKYILAKSEKKKYESRTPSFIPSNNIKGYCVVCGSEMRLDQSSEHPLKSIICIDCNSSRDFHKNGDYRTYHCHVCGKEHKNFWDSPLHLQCYKKYELQSRKILVFGYPHKSANI